jgi:hypothetical protein
MMCRIPGGLSTGAIVGIAIGCTAAVAILVTVVLIVTRRRELAKRNEEFQKQMSKRAKQGIVN